MVMSGATSITIRCDESGCRWSSFASRPGAALLKHKVASHRHRDPVEEELAALRKERDALRDHLQKFHICSARCSGEARP